MNKNDLVKNLFIYNDDLLSTWGNRAFGCAAIHLVDSTPYSLNLTSTPPVALISSGPISFMDVCQFNLSRNTFSRLKMAAPNSLVLKGSLGVMPKELAHRFLTKIKDLAPPTRNNLTLVFLRLYMQIRCFKQYRPTITHLAGKLNLRHQTVTEAIAWLIDQHIIERCGTYQFGVRGYTYFLTEEWNPQQLFIYEKEEY